MMYAKHSFGVTAATGVDGPDCVGECYMYDENKPKTSGRIRQLTGLRLRRPDLLHGGRAALLLTRSALGLRGQRLPAREQDLHRARAVVRSVLGEVRVLLLFACLPACLPVTSDGQSCFCLTCLRFQVRLVARSPQSRRVALGVRADGQEGWLGRSCRLLRPSPRRRRLCSNRRLQRGAAEALQPLPGRKA